MKRDRRSSIAPVIIVMAIIMASCAQTRYITVPEYHEKLVNTHDTVHQRDSFVSVTNTTIREVDSAQLAELGIYLKGIKSAYVVEIEKLRQEITRMKTSKSDTVIEKDTVTVPMEVPAQLTAWQSLKVRFGEIVLGILAIMAAVTAFTLCRRK